jgi:16S rRNA (guanine527-N7)-methyltransferase
MTASELQERVAARLSLANLKIPDDLARSLEAYFQLLAKWNRTINLSGMPLDDPAPETLDRLLIEPLMAATYAGKAARMIDIGSGGGSPAIPMGLMLRPTELVMVESKSRKAVFLTEAVRLVGLAGARVESVRYEALLESDRGRFDLLTVRAVRVSQEVLGSIQRFLQPGGSLMVFASAGSADAASASVPPQLRWSATHQLSGLLDSRLVIFQKTD